MIDLKKPKKGIFSIELGWTGLMGNFNMRVYSSNPTWTNDRTSEIIQWVMKTRPPQEARDSSVV